MIQIGSKKVNHVSASLNAKNMFKECRALNITVVINEN
jgi:hypothetical protein